MPSKLSFELLSRDVPIFTSAPTMSLIAGTLP